MPNANILEGGKDFSFLISDGESLQYLKDSKVIWQGKTSEPIVDISFDATRNAFWILGKKSISFFSVKDVSYQKLSGAKISLVLLSSGGKEMVVGTNDGYFNMDTSTKKQKGEVNKKLPWTDLTASEEVNGKLWFGSTRRVHARHRWRLGITLQNVGCRPTSDY